MNTIVRIAEPGDAMEVARVHVKAWQVAYRGLMADAYLDAIDPAQRAATYDFSHRDSTKPRTIVAAKGRAILGFATTAPASDLDGLRCGELCALYVDPACWGEGVGRALIAAARSHLADAGFGTAVLWVLAGNTRADTFYRRDGWRPDGVSRTLSVWGVTVDEVRYVRSFFEPVGKDRAPRVPLAPVSPR